MTTNRNNSSAPALILISATQKDQKSRDALRQHLAVLVRSGRTAIEELADAPPGTDLKALLGTPGPRVCVIALLLSAEFTSSDPCWRIMLWAEQLHQAEQIHLLPILVDHCDLVDTPIQDLKILPSDGLPISAHSESERQKEWSNIVAEIRGLLSSAPSFAPPASAGRTQLPEAITRASGADPIALQEARDRNNVGRARMYQGHPDEALKEFVEARDKLEQLVLRNLENIESMRELAKSYDRIGQARYGQGRLEEAREAFDQAFGYRNHVRVQASDNPNVLRDICASHYWRGHLAAIEGDLLRAWNEQQAGVTLSEALSAKQPDDPKVSRDLVVLQTDLGSTLRELGRTDLAERHLRSSLTRARHLAKEHPSNLQFQRDFAVGLFRLADVLLSTHRWQEALRDCEESTRICEELTQQDDDNVHWKRHVASAKLRLGAALHAKGEPEAALKERENAAVIMDALVALDGTNLQWLCDRAAINRLIAEQRAQLGDIEAARGMFHQAIAMLEDVCKQTCNIRWRLELLELYGAYCAVASSWTDVAGIDLPSIRERNSRLRSSLLSDPALRFWAKQRLASLANPPCLPSPSRTGS